METKELYALIRKIADMPYDYASSDIHRIDRDVPWLEDMRNEKVNPFYNQTATGLMFTVYYGQPGSIYTPWGEYSCWGSGSGYFEKYMLQLKDRLGLKIHTHAYGYDNGEWGPYYNITKVDSVVLPEPICTLRSLNTPFNTIEKVFGGASIDRRGYIEYKDARKIWDDLTTEWKTNRVQQLDSDQVAGF